jgi:hypothetical protein
MLPWKVTAAPAGVIGVIENIADNSWIPIVDAATKLLCSAPSQT